MVSLPRPLAASNVVCVAATCVFSRHFRATCRAPPSRVVPVAGSAVPESGPCPRGFFLIPLTPDDRQAIRSTEVLREPGLDKKMLRDSEAATSDRKLARAPLTTITATPSSDQKVLAPGPLHSTQRARTAYPSRLFHPFYKVQLHGLKVDIRI